MNFEHFVRLQKSRSELYARQLAIEDSDEARLAETLRPALKIALEALRQLRDDDSVWDAAHDAVQALHGTDLPQVREDYLRALPPLLNLFGYVVPPPPSAEQVANETVPLLKGLGDRKATAEEVEAARQSLGEILKNAEQLPREPPWKVVGTARELNGFLQLGLQTVLGSSVGALGGALIGVAGGAITGGIGPLAGGIVLGGVRRFQQVRAFERETEEFLTANQDQVLAATVFPATGEAIIQYLDKVLALSAQPGGDPHAALKVSAYLDAIIGISRRFVLRDTHRVTVIRQANLRHNHLPADLAPLLVRVHEAAERVRNQRAQHGSIPESSLAQLQEIRDGLRETLPRA